MTGAAHTPGPWRVEEGTTHIWGDCDPDDRTSYGMGYPVAEARVTPPRWGRVRDIPCEANARLIAAAPDLLEALRDAYRFISAPQRMDTPAGEPKTATYRVEGYNALTAKLRAAIAKATGQ